MDNPKLGLVLPGGGARGAYQAGVMKGIAAMLPADVANPFPVLTGTSVGAVNATVLASNARRFAPGVADLETVWRNFHCAQVFRCDASYVVRQGLHWLAALTLGGLGPANPRFLLDNAPLRDLLVEMIDFDAIAAAIEEGCLQAVAVTASSFDRAKAISFFEAALGHPAWSRSRREGVETKIGVDHLMASVAVPFVFPTVRLGNEFYGDGALREATPLSPVLHLGADRLLVIGVRDERAAAELAVPRETPPGFGEIAGYMLDALFLDGLYADLERMTRINYLLSLHAGEDEIWDKDAQRRLRPIDIHIIVPSQDVCEIATRHAREFPRAVRLLLRSSGALNARGAQLISYLLFEGPFCGELIDLGYRDALAQRDALLPFLAGEPVPPMTAPPHLMAALATTH